MALGPSRGSSGTLGAPLSLRDRTAFLAPFPAPYKAIFCAISIKGLSQNRGLLQGDVGELQMDESQIVADFLFPPDKEAPRAVRPGVTAFDDPAAGTLPSTTLYRSFTLAGNVRNVVEASRESLCGLAAVSLVQAQVLLGSSRGLGTGHGNRLQCGAQQRSVVSVGASDCDPQRYTAAIGYDGSLDAQFTTIGGVFTGFFPHLTAPWSWSRPRIANASRFRGAHHRFVDTSSRIDGRRVVGSIPGSIDAPYSANRTAVAKLSTGSPSATDRKCHWLRPADSHEAAHPSDCADTWATTVRTVATFSRASAQTDPSNRNSYPPPCKELKTSMSSSTLVVAVCSVSG